MALMLTTLHGSETQSKEFLYHFFWSKLSDQFYVWHDLILPKTGHRVDFAALHPNYGMWVIEVTEWPIGAVVSGNGKECILQEAGQEKMARNPVRIAYEKAATAKLLLEKHDALVNPNSTTQEKLFFAIHHIAVFTNISTEDFGLRDLGEVFPENHILTSDIVRNPLIDDATVENAFMKKRQPLFINALGLNRSQLAAIRKTFVPAPPEAEKTEPSPASESNNEKTVESDASPPEISEKIESVTEKVEATTEKAAASDEITKEVQPLPPEATPIEDRETTKALFTALSASVMQEDGPAEDETEREATSSPTDDPGEILTEPPDANDTLDEFLGADTEQLAGLKSTKPIVEDEAATESRKSLEELDSQIEAGLEEIKQAEATSEADEEKVSRIIISSNPQTSEQEMVEMIKNSPNDLAEKTEPEEAEKEERIIIQYGDEGEAPTATVVPITRKEPPQPPKTPPKKADIKPPQIDISENPGVELNKIIAYIVKQNEIILQRMWKKS